MQLHLSSLHTCNITVDNRYGLGSVVFLMPCIFFLHGLLVVHAILHACLNLHALFLWHPSKALLKVYELTWHYSYIDFVNISVKVIDIITIIGSMKYMRNSQRGWWPDWPWLVKCKVHKACIHGFVSPILQRLMCINMHELYMSACTTGRLRKDIDQGPFLVWLTMRIDCYPKIVD